MGSPGLGSGSGGVAPQDAVPSLRVPAWWDAAQARVLDKIRNAKDMGQVYAALLELAENGTKLSKEMDRRRDAANFTPGPGIVLEGDPAQQAAFLAMIKREMVRSPSFHRLVMQINSDTASDRQLKLILWENNRQEDTDAYVERGVQGFDMADLRAYPADPLPDMPSASIQGEHLAHALAEARAGTLISTPNPDRTFERAHVEGIQAQNEFRRDLGQPGERRMPPDDGDNHRVGSVITYSNGYREIVRRDLDGNVIGIQRDPPP